MERGIGFRPVSLLHIFRNSRTIALIVIGESLEINRVVQNLANNSCIRITTIVIEFTSMMNSVPALTESGISTLSNGTWNAWGQLSLLTLQPEMATAAKAVTINFNFMALIFSEQQYTLIR